ncbi:hypothetical protein AYI68_g6617 [Smittium mucronatum]|uniref:CID domain-containing protein n=1 Tax=Smittium mucronatum TaxID=133383 RepID=A0A1R0GR40_9FUNG|nr:hypothetical protein AYI68_g6617 [Smittium mucronatum]
MENSPSKEELFIINKLVEAELSNPAVVEIETSKLIYNSLKTESEYYSFVYALASEAFKREDHLQKLHCLYIINDIVFRAARDKNSIPLISILDSIPSLLVSLNSLPNDHPNSITLKFDKVLNLWIDKSAYSASQIAKVKASLIIPSTTLPNLPKITIKHNHPSNTNIPPVNYPSNSPIPPQSYIDQLANSNSTDPSPLDSNVPKDITPKAQIIKSSPSVSSTTLHPDSNASYPPPLHIHHPLPTTSAVPSSLCHIPNNPPPTSSSSNLTNQFYSQPFS